MGGDAEVVVEGGHDLLEVDRSVLGMFAETIGRADDLAGPHAAAGEEGGGDGGPVVAAGVLVDPRRPAELAPGDDGRVLEHVVGVEVFDQGAHALVELGAVVADEGEVLTVAVPAAITQGHNPRTGLDEAPGDQQLVVDRRGPVVLELIGLAVAVTLPDPRVFLAQVEGVDELAGGEDVEGDRRVLIHPGDGSVGIDLAPEGVERLEQAASVGQLLQRDPPELHVIQRGPVGLERRVRRPEEADRAGIRPGGVSGPCGQADERRDAGVDRPLQLGDRGSQARVAADDPEVALLPPGVALEGFVAVGHADDGPDDRRLVHHLRDPREDLADLDAGDVGGDRLELAPDLGGGLGLDVPHVLVRRPAAEEDVDHRLVRRFLRRGRPAGLGADEVGEGQGGGPERQPADLEEPAPADAVAVTP